VKSSSSLASRSRSLICPLCEAGKLQPSGQELARCASCAGPVSGAMLGALRQIVALPDALGKHACEECGHPEMRRLPDGTFHCQACRSEVLPVDASSTPSRPEEHAQAYWAGWVDGLFAERGAASSTTPTWRGGRTHPRGSPTTRATAQAVEPTGTGIVGTQTYAKSSSSDEQVRGGLCDSRKGGSDEVSKR